MIRYISVEGFVTEYVGLWQYKAMTYAVPNMEAAYSDLRPLFFGAFGKLARQGFVAAPTDTLDLIHDFFSEAWQGVSRNYDPAKGPFEKYVYVAFIRFVRPRIIDTIHLRNSTVDYERLIDVSDARLSFEPDFDVRIDIQKLNEAMDHLSEFDHNLLRQFLSFEAPSERTLAKRFDLSRYKLRSALISALGNLIVWLDKPYLVSELDWNVALSVWRDKRSFAGAATYHGLTVHQIKSSNLRVLKFLSQVLSNYQALGSLHSRSTNMHAQSTARSAEALFTEALRSPNNRELLEELRLRANEILTAIEHSDRFGPSDDELSKMDEGWIGTCYETIYGAVAVREVSGDVEEEFYATADDEESVGRAFGQSLMTIDREDIRLFEIGLYYLPAIDPAEQKELLATPSARGAGPYALPLARVGLTPLSIFYATEGVSYLIGRLVEQELLPVDNSILLDASEVLVNDEPHEVLTWDLTIDEIRRLSVCNSETAVGIYRWLIQVAQYRPYLFAGFKCAPVDRELAVRLSKSDRRFENLYQRWGFEDAHAGFEEVATA